MKPYLKNVFKVAILFFGLSLFLVNCQKDDTAPIQEIEEVSESNMSINYVSADKIPNIINLLGADNGSSSKSNSSKSNTISAPFGIISIESVLEVIDTLGNENYSFTLVPKTPKPNSIFNLVVNASNGSSNMAIMEYRMAPDFAQEYHTGLKTLAEFTGSILTFPFNPDSNLFAKGDTCIQNIDEVVNCDRIDLDQGQAVVSNGGAGTYTGFLETNTFTGGEGADINHNYGGATTGGPSRGFWLCNNNCSCGDVGPTVCVWVVPTPYSNTNKSTNTKKGGDCCDGTDIDGPVGVNLLTPAVDYITNCINDLTTEQIDFLKGSLHTFKIKAFLEENKNLDESCNEDASDFAKGAIEILIALPNAKFERIVELDNLLKENPWALIQDCAEQNGLDTSNYIDLHEHTIPQVCKDRLDVLGTGFSNQPITDGNVPLANIDYYGVEITNYPDFNNDGNPDSEAEIYQAFREKFTDLASGEKNDFWFSCDIPLNPTDTGHISWEFLPYDSFDSNLWNSNFNPISTIIGIDGGSNDFSLDIVSDDGAIIISEYTQNYWIGSTVTTSITSSQPFSGNREWGWLINENGNLEFYTRAVDVAKVSNLIRLTSLGSDPCQQETYYNIAKATWDNLQKEIIEWIEQEGNGLTGNITTKAITVEKAKLKQILESNESINQINCN